ncbi:hypothetical protein GINT2_000923 [Glugoides intestinalis]
MVHSQDSMSDSEIIQLLGEYSFTTKEMSEVLKSIKKRDFESVLLQIEEFRKVQGKWKVDDKEKMLEELKKRDEMQKMEDERNERYKTLLKEKIAANREEQKLREEQENETVVKIEPEMHIDADIKVRVLFDINKEIFVGLKDSSTVEDLYSRISSEIGYSTFQLSIFGINEVIQRSDKQLTEVFKAKAVMLDLNKTAN